MSNGKDLRKAQKAIKAGKPVVNPYKQDVLYTDMGQWMYPGQVTKIPSNQITMQGVPYPVQGVDDTGYSQMMYPGMNYTFPGQYVTEYPMAAYGGETDLPIIEDAGSFNKENIWVPDWKTMTDHAKKLGSKTVKTKSGVIINFDKNWQVKSADDNPIKRYGGDPSLPNITGHYQGGGWLDTYQDGGDYSIVNYLNSKNQNSSKEARKILAKNLGIKNYDFTAEKNLELLAKLKEESNKPKVKPAPVTPRATPYFPEIKQMPSETTQRANLKNKPDLTKKNYIKGSSSTELLNLINKNPRSKDILQEKKSQSTASKVWDAALHPMTALGNYDKYGYLPDNFIQGSNNLTDQALNIVNPAFYANALGKTVKNVFSKDTYTDLPKALASGALNVVGDQVPEGYNEAGLKTLERLADAAAVYGLKTDDLGLMYNTKNTLNKGTNALLDSPVSKKLINKIGEKKLKSILPEAFVAPEALTEEGLKQVSKINDLTNKYQTLNKDSYINNLRQKGYTKQQAKELARRESITLLGEYDLTNLHPDIVENITGLSMSEIAEEYKALANAKVIKPSSKVDNFVPKAETPLNLNPIKKNVSEISKLKNKQQFLEADPSGLYNENINPLQKLFRDQIIKRTIKNKYGMPMATADEFLLAEENQLIPIIESSGRNNARADLFEAGQRAKEIPKDIPYITSKSLSDNSLPIALSMIKRGLSNNSIKPVFMGYGPLNSMGHLEKFGNNPKLTLDFLNSKIGEFNKGLSNGVNLPNAFIKENKIYYPRIGVINKEYGGWLDTLQDGGLRAASTTGASAVSTKAPQVPLNNTDDYKTGIQYIQEKWKNRDPSDNWNLLMPDKYGSYVDSGVDPFALMLAAPQGAIKIAKEATNVAKNLKSKAYKINPIAEKLNNPNKSYRIAGLDAYEDFKNTGVLRSRNTEPGQLVEGTNFILPPRPTSFPSFQKGYADMRYANPEGSVVFETALPTFKRGELNPVTNLPIKGRHYAHRVIDPKTGTTMTEIPASDIRAFGDQPHWWKGYQEIPNSSVKNAKTVNDKIGDIKNKIQLQRDEALMLKYNIPQSVPKNKFLSGDWKNANQNFVNQNPLDANAFNAIREAPIDPKYLDNFLLNNKPSQGIQYDPNLPKVNQEMIDAFTRFYKSKKPSSKYGGQKKLKRTTSKNIQSSINDLMLRNETLFGPPGKVRYKPKLKYGQGGWLDQFDK